MKKLFFLPISLLLIIQLCACEVKENMSTSNSVIFEPQAEVQCTERNTIGTTASTEIEGSESSIPRENWPCISENVYDLSTLVADLPENISKLDIWPEEQLLIGYDYTAEEYLIIPFNLDELELRKDDTIAINEVRPGSGVYHEYELKAGNIVIHKTDLNEFKNTSTTFDINSGSMVYKRDFAMDTTLCSSIDPSNILLLYSETDLQTIVEANINNKEENIVLNWKIPTVTAKPRLTALNQGKEGYAFLGQSFPSRNAQSVPCFGLVDNKGNIVTCTIKHQFDAEGFYGGMVIYDTIHTYGTNESMLGKFIIMDANSMSVREIVPETSEECMDHRLIVSPNGKYILSWVSSESGKTYRVYDTETCELVAKFENNEPPQEHEKNCIRLIEDEHAFIVLTQSSGMRQLLYYKYNE